MSDEKNTEETPKAEPQLHTLKVDRKEVQVDYDELVRRAQLGSKRERWESELQAKQGELQADADAFRGYQQLRDWMAANPAGAAKMRAIYAGQEPAKVEPVSDYNRESNPTLSQPSEQPANPQVEAQMARLAQLEASLSARLAALDQRSQENSVAEAIASQTSVSGNDGAQAMLEKMVKFELSQNPSADPREVAAEAAAAIQSIASQQQQQTLNGRLEGSELQTLPPTTGAPSIVPQELLEVAPGKGRNELRNGGVKKAAADWLAQQARGLVQPPGN